MTNPGRGLCCLSFHIFFNSIRFCEIASISIFLGSRPFFRYSQSFFHFYRIKVLTVILGKNWRFYWRSKNYNSLYRVKNSSEPMKRALGSLVWRNEYTSSVIAECEQEGEGEIEQKKKSREQEAKLNRWLTALDLLAIYPQLEKNKSECFQFRYTHWPLQSFVWKQSEECCATFYRVSLRANIFYTMLAKKMAKSYKNNFNIFGNICYFSWKSWKKNFLSMEFL